MSRTVGIMAVLVGAVGIASAAALAEDALPAGVRGFSGQARGVVGEKLDNHRFTFKVGRVLKVWKGNRAENAESLVGLTVRVGARREGGQLAPRQVAFIDTLRGGEEITLDLGNGDGPEFFILELNADQRERAGGTEAVERREGGDRPKEGGDDINQLKRQIEQLRRENEELRRRISREREE